MIVRMVLLLIQVAVVASSMTAFAQTENAKPASAQSDSLSSPLEEKSPWIIAPVFSANPKLGASLGALGGYVHYFDDKSRPSIFAITGQYSSTNSIVAGAQARTSFDEDRQRLIAGMVYGYVKNDYSDYLGTGVPLQSNGELLGVIARYLYRVRESWFIGGQGIYQNFMVGGETAFDEQVLDILGVKPYRSGGVGLVVYRDSRDNENMPTGGWLLSFSNLAYREALGSENNFDVFRTDFRYYLGHGKGNVFTVRQLNHLTSDAPTVARASVQLRGYKIGQYNSNYMSSIEGEERLRLGKKWTATIFAGLAYLYGGGNSGEDSTNLYPAGGAGVQYILKPKEGIVLNLEFAAGKEGNYGLYLKMGYGY